MLYDTYIYIYKYDKYVFFSFLFASSSIDPQPRSQMPYFAFYSKVPPAQAVFHPNKARIWLGFKGNELTATVVHEKPEDSQENLMWYCKATRRFSPEECQCRLCWEHYEVWIHRRICGHYLQRKCAKASSGKCKFGHPEWNKVSKAGECKTGVVCCVMVARKLIRSMGVNC